MNLLVVGTGIVIDSISNTCAKVAFAEKRLTSSEIHHDFQTLTLFRAFSITDLQSTTLQWIALPTIVQK